MRLYVWQSIFFLAIIFACSNANAGSIAKRQIVSSLSSLVDSIEGILGGIPLIGSSLSGLVKWIVQIFNLFEQATNGAIARLLGGALPCTVDLDGTTCQGLKNNGGIGKVLMDVIDGLPSLLFPGIFKSIVKLAINSLVDPTADVIFGGVSVNK